MEDGGLGRQYAPATDFLPAQGFSHNESMSGAQIEDPYRGRSSGRPRVQQHVHRAMRGSSNASSKLCSTQTDGTGLDTGLGTGAYTSIGTGMGTGTGIDMDTGEMGTESGMGLDRQVGMYLESQQSALEVEMEMQLVPSWDTLLHSRLPVWSGNVDALNADAGGHQAGFGRLEDAQSS